MIAVIEDGSKKVFFTQCYNCASELEYTLADTGEEKISEYLTTKQKYIVCPICGQKMSASLLTKEQQDRILSLQPHFYQAAPVCSIQPEKSDCDNK